MKLRRLTLALAALAGLVACDDDDPLVGVGQCVSDEAFFQEVSLSILEVDCANCHNAQGAARETDFVLAAAGESDSLRRNFEMMKELAAFERDGESIILLKPTMTIAHEGGPRFGRDSAQFRQFKELVDRFDNPRQCQTGGYEALVEKLRLATPVDTLRKAKVQLVGELPTAEEIALVQAEGIDAMAPLLDEWMTRDAFYGTLRRWYNDLLLTDKYLGGNRATDLLDDADFPGRYYYVNLPDDTEEGQLAKRYTNDSVAREPLDLITHVVRNDRPFTEVLTADYILVNPYSARVYGVEADFDDPTDPTEFREGRIPGYPHAGILTSPMFLNRFPTTDTNRNRHRARMVYSLFLATDILRKAERPVDPTQIRDHNPTMNNAQCTVCHASIDPIAGAFQNFDARGRFRVSGEQRKPQEGWYEDMRPAGYGDAIVPPDEWSDALGWLAERVVADERFALSAVYAVYTGLVGRAPLDNPTDTSDPRFAARLDFYNFEQAFLRRVTDHFVEQGYALKSIVPEIVQSPFYRAYSASGLTDHEHVMLEPMGTARLLTPEELDRRITATLGQPWKRRVGDRNLLLSSQEYLYFYGGIDSNDITRRITEPNGVMANIAMRMASEMGCLMTPRDFRLPLRDRVLFPYVEATYRPEDENGFVVPAAESAIRQNIRHLHAHLLGEEIEAGGEEEEATWRLFLETWRDGRAGQAAGEIGNDLPNHCKVTRDFWSDAELPAEERLERDPNYTLRAWSAVVTYLLADWRFLYHR
ncbi:MAG: DUF1588 domain-containing protein [Myxococcales bacterium]|nr:DUF1588 domain-containing protein [Myxococcales bacterium]